MPVLLFLLNAVCYAGQSATGKYYAAKGGQAESFNLCKAVSAAALFLIWLLIGGELHYPTVPLGILYGLCLAVSMHTGFVALSLGPMALTGIIAAMSLLIPFAWGLIFWQEPCTLTGIIGILILLCAFFLINYTKQGRFSAKWLLYSLCTLAANGVCSVIQKYHQLMFPGLYRQDFMFVSMATVAAILLLRHWACGKGKLSFSILGVCSGILNGLANYTVLILAGSQAASVLFPLISAENVMAAWLAGTLLFRERIRKLQILGVLLGILGLILFNL